MIFSEIVNTPNVNECFDQDIEDKLIVYLHVPKAAGNSSIKPIKEHFKQNLSIKWNEIDKSWSKFVQEHSIHPQFKFVSGHIHDKHIDLLIEQEINYYLITFIRHPIERIMSLYAYNTMSTTPNSEKFKKKFESFQEFACNGVPPNAMSRTLFRGCLSVNEGINKLYSKYNFVGISEQFNFSMLLLSKMIGFKFYKYKRLNVSKYKENEFAIDYKLYSDLLKRHSIDIAIYEHVKNDYVRLMESYVVNEIL